MEISAFNIGQSVIQNLKSEQSFSWGEWKLEVLELFLEGFPAF
jgi:hypothetical protein